MILSSTAAVVHAVQPLLEAPETRKSFTLISFCKVIS